jgi:acetate kinase
MRLLVVNVGSSTIKLRVVEKGRAVEALDLERRRREAWRGRCATR